MTLSIQWYLNLVISLKKMPTTVYVLVCMALNTSMVPVWLATV